MSERQLSLEGVFLPVTTPFEADSGDVDRDAYLSNLRSWLAGPVDGIVVAGSTGEAPLLDEIEILRLVEWAREAPLGDRPLVAGTGLESTRSTVRLCREVHRVGADAVLVRAPMYYGDAMTPEALEAHYREVADASPVPVVLYHVPKYVPVELEPDLVGRLSHHENVVAIKDSSGDVRNLGELVEAADGRIDVLVGHGSLLYGGLEVGASGGVLAVGLLATSACGELVDAWREGDTERAGSIQERVGALNTAVVGGLGVPGVKAGLDHLGLRGGPVRSPLQALGQGGRQKVEAALSAAGLGRAIADRRG